MPKDQATKGGDKSPLVELSVLFPIGGKVAVLEPHTKGSGKSRADRQSVLVTMRALSAKEIAQQLQRVMEIADKIEANAALARVVTEHFDDFCGLLSLATDDERSAEWLGALDGGDFLRAVKTFLGANADFFTEAADLFVGATAARVKAAMSGGPMPSSNSQPQDSQTP